MDKMEAVASLLNDCQEQYHNSAIFLFFRGRLERMKVILHKRITVNKDNDCN